MKRSFDQTDIEDVFHEGVKASPSQSSDDSCQFNTRKRRRGVIEKRRRDRINNCLSELRRLVPQAFEKQGTSKLEKAEILQMTVDHLRTLHSKGVDVYHPYGDINKIAMDYHSIGFRECASEVARYLVTSEGMDIQDPLRLRLMSHLQCFSAQREMTVKQTSWTPLSNPLSTNYSSSQFNNALTPNIQQHPQGDLTVLSSALPSHNTLPALPYSNEPPRMSTQVPAHHMRFGSASASTSNIGPPAALSHPPQPSSSSQYPMTSSYFQAPLSPGSQLKPYRPWGTELAC